jgi:hypothetical protein
MGAPEKNSIVDDSIRLYSYSYVRCEMNGRELELGLLRSGYRKMTSKVIPPPALTTAQCEDEDAADRIDGKVWWSVICT